MFSNLIFVNVTWMLIVLAESQRLPEYVTSECYGNSFNFECGQGHKIRINRDFFGHSSKDICSPSLSDCVVANQKTDSLIHRYCTGKRKCPYFQVERRACNGVYTNYQQVEYQCVPDNRIVDICQNIDFETREVFISSTNFPQNYPPELDCSCFVSSSGSGALVHLEVVYMSILYSFPCRDWLRVGRTRMCGITVDLFSGQHIPLEFHSDKEGGHSGFWLQMQASQSDASLYIRCRNSTLRSMFSEQRGRSNSRPSRIPSSLASHSTHGHPSSQHRVTVPHLTKYQTSQSESSISPEEVIKRSGTEPIAAKEVTPSNASNHRQPDKEMAKVTDRTQNSDIPVIGDIGDADSFLNHKDNSKTGSTNNKDQVSELSTKSHSDSLSSLSGSEEEGIQEGQRVKYVTKPQYVSRQSVHRVDPTVEGGSENKGLTLDNSTGNQSHKTQHQNQHTTHNQEELDQTEDANQKNKESSESFPYTMHSTFPSTIDSNSDYEELDTSNKDDSDYFDNDGLLHTVHSFSRNIPYYRSPENSGKPFTKENSRAIKDNLNIKNQDADDFTEPGSKRMTTPPATFDLETFIQRKLAGNDSGIIQDPRKVKEIYSRINSPIKDTARDLRGEKTKPPEILNHFNSYINNAVPPVKPRDNIAKSTNDEAFDNFPGLQGQRDHTSTKSDRVPDYDQGLLSGRGNKSSLGIYPDTRANISNVGANILQKHLRKNDSTLQTGHVEEPHSGYPTAIDHSVDKGSGSTIYKDINEASTGELEGNFNSNNDNNYGKDSKQMDTSSHHIDGVGQHPDIRQQKHMRDEHDLKYFNNLTPNNYSMNSSIAFNGSVSNSGGKPISPLQSTELLFPSRNDMINASLSPEQDHGWNINELSSTTEKLNVAGNYPQIVPKKFTQSYPNNTQISPRGFNYDKSDSLDIFNFSVSGIDSEVQKYTKPESTEHQTFIDENKTTKKEYFQQGSQNDLQSIPQSQETVSQPMTPMTDLGTVTPKKKSYYYYYEQNFNIPEYTETSASVTDEENANIDLITKNTQFNWHTESNRSGGVETGIINKDVFNDKQDYIDTTKVSVAPHYSQTNYESQFDNGENPYDDYDLTNEPVSVKPEQEMTSPVQLSADPVQNQVTGGLLETTIGWLDVSGFRAEDVSVWAVTHVNEESAASNSPGDDLIDDKVVLLGEEERDKKLNTNSTDPEISTESSTDVLESSYGEADNIVTIGQTSCFERLSCQSCHCHSLRGTQCAQGVQGLIILSICIGAGIILLTCFVIAILWHRRRRRITNASVTRPTLAIIHAQKEMLSAQQSVDGDSGRSLIVNAQKSQDSAQIDSYAKGRGHQSVLDADSLYTKPKKKDKILQIDMDDIYEEVTIHHQKRPQSKKKKKSSVAPGVAAYMTHQNSPDGHLSVQSLHNQDIPTGQTMILMHPDKGTKRDMFILPSSTYNFRNTMPITTIREEEFENEEAVEEEQGQQGHVKPSIPPKPKFRKTKSESSDSGVTLSQTPDGNSTSSVASDTATIKKKTIASMPGLSEVTFMPENSPVFYEVEEEAFSEEDDSDWETRSAISL